MLDDRRALICTEKQLKILDLPSAIVTRAISGKCGYDIGSDQKRGLRPGLLNEEQVLAVSGGRKHLKIMSLTTGELVKVLKADLIGGQIESLLVSRNGSTAVAFGWHAAEVWDISTYSCKVCVPENRRASHLVLFLTNPFCLKLVQ